MQRYILDINGKKQHGGRADPPQVWRTVRLKFVTKHDGAPMPPSRVSVQLENASLPEVADQTYGDRPARGVRLGAVTANEPGQWRSIVISSITCFRHDDHRGGRASRR